MRNESDDYLDIPKCSHRIIPVPQHLVLRILHYVSLKFSGLKHQLQIISTDGRLAKNGRTRKLIPNGRVTIVTRTPLKSIESHKWWEYGAGSFLLQEQDIDIGKIVTYNIDAAIKEVFSIGLAGLMMSSTKRASLRRYDSEKGHTHLMSTQPNFGLDRGLSALKNYQNLSPPD